MNKKIVTFLDDVCIHIRCKKIHKDIRDELANHIYELKDEYVNEGYDEEKALDMAIFAMGNCDEIGERLNKKHKPETEWSLIGLITIIAIIGGIIMFTSSRFESIQAVSFKKYLISAGIGIVVMVGFYFFDYTKLKKLAFPIYSITFLMLIFALFQGAQINGVGCFSIGGISVSPACVTILFLVAIAGFIEKSRGQGELAIMGILILALGSVLPIILLHNFSTAIVLMACYAVLIISSVIKNHFGGNRRIQATLLGGIGVLSVCFITFNIITSPYRFRRILSFLTRGQSAPSDEGWIQIMADKWLSVSALFGKATGAVNGYTIDKAMPSITTDYVLINIIANFGWVVGIVLVLVIAIFIGRMFAATMKIKNGYGFYLSLGACTILSVQFAINVLMNFNLFPLMGISLPFISYGGLSYIVNMALLGIILSTRRMNNLIGASQKTIVESSSRFIKFEDGKLIIKFK